MKLKPLPYKIAYLLLFASLFEILDISSFSKNVFGIVSCSNSVFSLLGFLVSVPAVAVLSFSFPTISLK